MDLISLSYGSDEDNCNVAAASQLIQISIHIYDVTKQLLGINGIKDLYEYALSDYPYKYPIWDRQKGKEIFLNSFLMMNEFFNAYLGKLQKPFSIKTPKPALIKLSNGNLQLGLLLENSDWSLEFQAEAILYYSESNNATITIEVPDINNFPSDNTLLIDLVSSL